MLPEHCETTKKLLPAAANSEEMTGGDCKDTPHYSPPGLGTDKSGDRCHKRNLMKIIRAPRFAAFSQNQKCSKTYANVSTRLFEKQKTKPARVSHSGKRNPRATTGPNAHETAASSRCAPKSPPPAPAQCATWILT